jgi:hypothetical protein
MILSLSLSLSLFQVWMSLTKVEEAARQDKSMKMMTSVLTMLSLKRCSVREKNRKGTLMLQTISHEMYRERVVGRTEHISTISFERRCRRLTLYQFFLSNESE